MLYLEQYGPALGEERESTPQLFHHELQWPAAICYSSSKFEGKTTRQGKMA